MTLVRSPFKKRQTIAGINFDGSKKSTPNGTPKSLRSEKERRASTSSVNSFFEDSDETNKCLVVCEPINPDNNASVSNNEPDIPEVPRNSPEILEILKVPMINECHDFEECLEVDQPNPLVYNSSKNNLLELEERPEMTSSIDCHLDQIDRVNRNLDKILEARHLSCIEPKDDPEKYEKIESHETIQDRIRFKDKIADKLKNLKESKLANMSSDDLKNRIKKMNVFKKQSSQEDAGDFEEITEDSTVKSSKKRALKLSLFSSFREKKKDPESPGPSASPKPEPEEEFEEVGNENYARLVQTTDLDAEEELDGSSGSFRESSGKSKKIKLKLRKNLHKLNLKLSKNKIFGKKSSSELEICSKCTKRRGSIQDCTIHPSNAVFDFSKEFHVEQLLTENDFCICEDDDDDDLLSFKKHDPGNNEESVSIFCGGFFCCMLCGSFSLRWVFGYFLKLSP